MSDDQTPQIASVAPAAEPLAPLVYKDEDLVYVDPDKRTVVGLVEFNKAGNPKSLAMKMEEVDDDEEEVAAPKADAAAKPDAKGRVRRPRIRRQRFYPWGTYRSMKKIYKIEGKQRAEASQKTLDEVMEKALKEPFWD